MCDQLTFLCQQTMQVSDLWHPAQRCQDNYMKIRDALKKERDKRMQERRNLIEHAEVGPRGLPRETQTTQQIDLGIAEVATPLLWCSVTRWGGLHSLWV